MSERKNKVSNVNRWIALATMRFVCILRESTHAVNEFYGIFTVFYISSYISADIL